MLEILGIEPGSIAEELQIQPGDRLLSINGQPVRDLVDYMVALDAEEIVFEIERNDGELWDLEIEYDRGDTLGLILPHPEPTQCGNNCIFCFVHQLPKGLRRSLYVKDEDYRFSYLYGAYVTLSNIDSTALERVITQKLSPMYVSVHATDEDLRRQLLGRQAPPILELLEKLVANGIKVHAQIVVCPGINDGEVLHRTYADLVSLAPGIRSLAIVPVGLTGYREHLPDLRTLSSREAREILDWLHAKQGDCLETLATRFIYAADELYLAAALDFPDLIAYEDLPQIENGVGLIPVFRRQAREVLEQATPLKLPPISLVTGRSAAGELNRFVDELAVRVGISLKVFALDNQFFGGHVTVTGLLVGQDLFGQLTGQDLGEILLIPDVMLREGEDVLLDDVRVSELADRLSVQVEVIASDPWGIWDMLEAIAYEPLEE
jgi:putative radical SAM enzyme (TIGR03279 family)